MTTLRQAAQQALMAHTMLRDWIKAVPQEVVLPAMPGIDGDWLDEVESNLRAALEQPEPVRDLYDEGFRSGLGISSSYKEEARAYKEAYFKLIENVASMKAFEPTPPIVISTPPAAQRPWVELTASTILNLMPESIPAEHDGALMEFARDIEAKLKENT